MPRVVAYDVWQSSPSVFINLVVVIERGFVCMEGDLNYFLPWLSSFLQFDDDCLSGRMVYARVFVMLPCLCMPILDLAYQTSVFGRWIIVKYKGPFLTAAFWETLQVAGQDLLVHRLWPTSLDSEFSVFCRWDTGTGLCWVLIEEYPLCHPPQLQNLVHVVVIVLTASKPEVLGQIFEVNVWESHPIVVA